MSLAFLLEVVAPPLAVLAFACGFAALVVRGQSKLNRRLVAQRHLPSWSTDAFRSLSPSDFDIFLVAGTSLSEDLVTDREGTIVGRVKDSICTFKSAEVRRLDEGLRLVGFVPNSADGETVNILIEPGNRAFIAHSSRPRILSLSLDAWEWNFGYTIRDGERIVGRVCYMAGVSFLSDVACIAVRKAETDLLGAVLVQISRSPPAKP